MSIAPSLQSRLRAQASLDEAPEFAFSEIARGLPEASDSFLRRAFSALSLLPSKTAAAAAPHDTARMLVWHPCMRAPRVSGTSAVTTVRLRGDQVHACASLDDRAPVACTRAELSAEDEAFAKQMTESAFNASATRLRVPLAPRASVSDETRAWLRAARTENDERFDRAWTDQSDADASRALLHTRADPFADPALVVACARPTLPARDAVRMHATQPASPQSKARLLVDTRACRQKLEEWRGFIDTMNKETCALPDAAYASQLCWRDLFMHLLKLGARTLHGDAPLAPLIGHHWKWLPRWCAGRICFSTPWMVCRGVLETMTHLACTLWFGQRIHATQEDSAATRAREYELVHAPTDANWSEAAVGHARASVLGAVLSVTMRDDGDEHARQTDLRKLLQALKVLCAFFFLQLCVNLKDQIEKVGASLHVSHAALEHARGVLEHATQILCALTPLCETQRAAFNSTSVVDERATHLQTKVARSETFTRGLLFERKRRIPAEHVLNAWTTSGAQAARDLCEFLKTWVPDAQRPTPAPLVSVATRAPLMYLHASVTFAHASKDTVTTHDQAVSPLAPVLEALSSDAEASSVHALHLFVQHLHATGAHAAYTTGQLINDSPEATRDAWNAFFHASSEQIRAYRAKRDPPPRLLESSSLQFPQLVREAFDAVGKAERATSAADEHMQVLRHLIAICNAHVHGTVSQQPVKFVRKACEQLAQRDVHADVLIPPLVVFHAPDAFPTLVGISFLVRNVGGCAAECHAVFVAQDAAQHFWLMVVRTARVSQRLSALLSDALHLLAHEQLLRDKAWRPTATWMAHAVARHVRQLLRQSVLTCEHMCALLEQQDARLPAEPAELFHFQHEARAASLAHAIRRLLADEEYAETTDAAMRAIVLQSMACALQPESVAARS